MSLEERMDWIDFSVSSLNCVSTKLLKEKKTSERQNLNNFMIRIRIIILNHKNNEQILHLNNFFYILTDLGYVSEREKERERKKPELIYIINLIKQLVT